MKKIKSIPIEEMMPLYILLAVALIFGVLTKGKVFQPSNMANILNQSVPYFLCALGMIFVVAIGGTDITCGSLIGLTAALGTMAATKVGFFMLFPVVIIIGAASGLFAGTIASKFKVPSFMVSLSLLLGLRALVTWILQTDIYLITKPMRLLDKMYVKFPIFIVLFVIFCYIFHFTPYGKYLQAIGENELAVEYSGVNVDKMKIIAFVISGALAAVAGVFTVVRVGGTNNTLGAGMEMRVMLCLFLASIPVQGGSGTKMHKMIIGVLTYFILDNGLTLLGNPSIVNQLIRAVVLLAALTLTRVISEQTVKRNIQKSLEDTAA